jgi:hypothetical protein
LLYTRDICKYRRALMRRGEGLRPDAHLVRPSALVPNRERTRILHRNIDASASREPMSTNPWRDDDAACATSAAKPCVAKALMPPAANRTRVITDSTIAASLPSRVLSTQLGCKAARRADLCNVTAALTLANDAASIRTRVPGRARCSSRWRTCSRVATIGSVDSIES